MRCAYSWSTKGWVAEREQFFDRRRRQLEDKVMIESISMGMEWHAAER